MKLCIDCNHVRSTPQHNIHGQKYGDWHFCAALSGAYTCPVTGNEEFLKKRCCKLEREADEELKIVYPGTSKEVSSFDIMHNGVGEAAAIEMKCGKSAKLFESNTDNDAGGE